MLNVLGIEGGGNPLPPQASVAGVDGKNIVRRASFPPEMLELSEGSRVLMSCSTSDVVPVRGDPATKLIADEIRKKTKGDNPGYEQRKTPTPRA